VEVRQMSHEFNFGCNLFYLDQFEDKRDELYRNNIKQIFNYGVLPLYWDTLEPEEGKVRFAEDCVKIHRKPPLDTVVKFCEENSIRMKGHCMIYHNYQPDWMPESNRDIKIKIDERIKAVAERYGNAFADLDVINEMVYIYKNCYKGNCYQGKGVNTLPITDERDHEKWSFDICKKYFPHTRLFWNEDVQGSFGSFYRGYRSYYYMALKEWMNAGAPIEGIGMQYHLFGEKEDIYEKWKEVCNPLRIKDALECYGEFDLPIHISEITIPSFTNEENDEMIQAELVKRLYKLWFSSKNCNAIVWWNLGDGTASKSENIYHAGLLREDCSRKPAYDVLNDLIHKEWNTSFDTMVNGRLNFRGFYGDYEITAEYKGQRIKKKIRLFKENTGYDNELCDFRSVNIKFTKKYI